MDCTRIRFFQGLFLIFCGIIDFRRFQLDLVKRFILEVSMILDQSDLSN